MNKFYIFIYVGTFLTIGKYKYISMKNVEVFTLQRLFEYIFFCHPKKFTENQVIHNFDY